MGNPSEKVGKRTGIVRRKRTRPEKKDRHLPGKRTGIFPGESREKDRGETGIPGKRTGIFPGGNGKMTGILRVRPPGRLAVVTPEASELARLPRADRAAAGRAGCLERARSEDSGGGSRQTMRGRDGRRRRFARRAATRNHRAGRRVQPCRRPSLPVRRLPAVAQPVKTGWASSQAGRAPQAEVRMPGQPAGGRDEVESFLRPAATASLPVTPYRPGEEADHRLAR